jgi:hypothetical protein
MVKVFISKKITPGTATANGSSQNRTFNSEEAVSKVNFEAVFLLFGYIAFTPSFTSRLLQVFQKTFFLVETIAINETIEVKMSPLHRPAQAF